jgi:putative transposase
MGVALSALAYQSVRKAKDAPILARLTTLSGQYPRYGYRRIAIFLARDGHDLPR